MTFASILKDAGFKKHNVNHLDGSKSSYWFLESKQWYAEIWEHKYGEEVMMSGKGLRYDVHYFGGHFYQSFEELKEELTLKS